MEKSIFLDLHLKRSEIGFWDENFKSTIILLLECSYQKDVLREWGISDLVVNGNKILLQWYKRLLPLTDEEILTKYGR